MKYTNQLNKMVSTLRSEGIEVKLENNTAYITNTSLAFETSSVTNIYNNGELVKQFKTPNSAIKFLLSI